MAVANYADEYGSFPPAYVPDSDGTPMHSWRVLLLPYIDNKDVYDSYDFTNPWNSPGNSKLESQISGFLKCPNDSSSLLTTNYVAVVGPNTIWQGANPVSEDAITDGLSNTILFIEIATPDIHLLEPRDISIEHLISKLQSNRPVCLHPGLVNLVFADGHVRSIDQKKLTPKLLRALLTINGGEDISLDLY